MDDVLVDFPLGVKMGDTPLPVCDARGGSQRAPNEVGKCWDGGGNVSNIFSLRKLESLGLIWPEFMNKLVEIGDSKYDVSTLVSVAVLELDSSSEKNINIPRKL